MLTFYFDGAEGRMLGSDVLTTGMIGREIRLEFSPEWDGMSKTAVFTAGELTRNVLVESGVVAIPGELLEHPMSQLFVGVYGASQDGRAIPTILVPGPYVCQGTNPSGDESVDPALPVWAQLQVRLETLENGVLEVDLTSLNLHYEESGTWIYPLGGILDVGELLDDAKAGRQIWLRFQRKGYPLTVMLDSCRIKDGAAACSGIFAEALSGSDAVRGIITLEIFSPDNAVLVACMNPPAGITPEQAEQLQANTEAIESIPVSRSDDGYTQITGQRHPVSMRVVREGSTVTLITTLQGDVVHQDVITLDERGIPVSLIAGGVECALDYVGFEEEDHGI